jgi:hypothetical protein
VAAAKVPSITIHPAITMCFIPGFPFISAWIEDDDEDHRPGHYVWDGQRYRLQTLERHPQLPKVRSRDRMRGALEAASPSRRSLDQLDGIPPRRPRRAEIEDSRHGRVRRAQLETSPPLRGILKNASPILRGRDAQGSDESEDVLKRRKSSKKRRRYRSDDDDDDDYYEVGDIIFLGQMCLVQHVCDA